MQILQYINNFSSIKPCLILRQPTFPNNLIEQLPTFA
uniref:Uncharacterized protein n=1 Tax=Arundo donax TaxID=35708 RepID=A0A0A9FTP9_ARUDO